jgi:hypothetical protein
MKMVFAMGEKELISLVRDAPKVLEQVYTDLAQPSVRASQVFSRLRVKST